MEVIHFRCGHVVPIQLHISIREEISKVCFQEVCGKKKLDRKNWYGLLRRIFWSGPTAATVANFQQYAPVWSGPRAATVPNIQGVGAPVLKRHFSDLPKFHKVRVAHAIS